MPSPKAVLRDIADLGLDPKKHYTPVSGGRLGTQVHGAVGAESSKSAAFAMHAPRAAEPAGVEPEKPARPALVKLAEPEPKVEEPTPVEVPTAVEAAPEEKKEDVTPDVVADENGVIASSKKLRGKKAEKPAG
jgi:hypothetical protein